MHNGVQYVVNIYIIRYILMGYDENFMRKFPLLDIYVYMNASGGEFRRLH
jgi:hypothetical protein